MAKYTTQLRTLIEGGVDLFDFSYPIFDENYRGVLEQKIKDRYFFREIGLETVGQFKHFLKMKLNEIMPYYNRLYETEGIITKDNFMINLDNTITRTNQVNTETAGSANSTRNNTNEVTQTSDSSTTDSGTGRQVYSDTPQGNLADLDYATNLTDNESSGTSTSTGTGEATTTDTGTESVSNTGTLTTIEQYTEHLLGNGSMRYNADILQEWRDTMLNIDVMILDDLNDLFMNVY